MNPYASPQTINTQPGIPVKWKLIGCVLVVDACLIPLGHWANKDLGELAVRFVNWLPTDVADHFCAFLKVLTG